MRTRAPLGLSLGERMVRMLPRDRTPAVLGPLGGDWRFKDATELPPALSVLVLPLMARERLLGMLVILRRSPESRALSRGELDRASLLTSHAVLALENGRMAGQLSASERMASVGLVAAGISHEINNPTTFVLGNLQFIQQGLATLGRSMLREAQGSRGEPPRGGRASRRSSSPFSRRWTRPTRARAASARLSGTCGRCRGWTTPRRGGST